MSAPAERGELRPTPSEPANPSRRKFLRLVTAVGYTSATAMGAGVGLVLNGAGEALEIGKLTNAEYPLVPGAEIAVRNEIKVFEAKAVDEIRGAFARGDSAVTIPLPTDLSEKAADITRRYKMQSEVYGRIAEQTKTDEKLSIGIPATVGGALGVMLAVGVEAMVNNTQEVQVTTPLVPQEQ